MTARQVYDYLLIELNKVEAPTLLLEDFTYFLNKAIINYSDKRYNLYELSQQLTDDLGVLSATTVITTLTPKTGNSLQGATYQGKLPQDYFHLLGVVAEFKLLKVYNCKPIGSEMHRGVKKLTSQMYTGIIDNFYYMPSAMNPYYFLHNSVSPATLTSTPGSNHRTAGDRKGNPAPVNMEVRYGKDNTACKLEKVYVDYLRVPQYMILTVDQLESIDDTSQLMEFPDYACYEIIKELVALLMENFSDPRLQTNIPVNQSIAPPMGGGKNR